MSINDNIPPNPHPVKPPPNLPPPKQMSQPDDRDKWINLSAIHEKEIYDLQGKVAALKAENERLKTELKASNNYIKANNLDPSSINAEGVLRQNISIMIDRRNEKIKELTAKNERLRKAGDAMAKWFNDGGFYGFGFQEAWNAAKEGRDAK